MSQSVPSNFNQPGFQPSLGERHTEALGEQQSQVQILGGEIIEALYKPLFDLAELAAEPISFCAESIFETALGIKNIYQSFFDPKYIEMHSFLKNRGVEESVAKILSLARNGPQDLLRYSLYIIDRDAPFEILNSLFESPFLTPADLAAIREAGRPWMRKGYTHASVMKAFFERKSTSLLLMKAFCSHFKSGFVVDGREQLPYEAFGILNRNPSLLKVVLDAYSSAKREKNLALWEDGSIAIRVGLISACKRLFKCIDDVTNQEAFKAYLEFIDEDALNYLCKSQEVAYIVYLDEINLNNLEIFLEKLNDFVDKYPQCISVISKFSQKIIEKSSGAQGDTFSDNTSAVALFLFRLSQPLPESWLNGNLFFGEKLINLYASKDFRHISAHLTFDEFNEFIKTFSQFDPKYQNVCRLSPDTMSDLARVASKELNEEESKKPRLLIAKALYQWLYHPLVVNSHSDSAKALGLNDRKSVHISNIDRLAIVQPRELSRGQNGDFQLEDGIKGGGGKGTRLVISHEGKEAKLSPHLALALLNGSKDITWGELAVEPRTIDCTLDEETGIVILSATDQMLLAGYSKYFSAYFSTIMQSPLLNDVSDEAILDLLNYLADPFLTFTDVDHAINILATADFLEAPSLIDRAVTWLNNHFYSLETDEEREAFVKTLLDEDSPISSNSVLHQIQAGDTYKLQVKERLSVEM